MSDPATLPRDLLQANETRVRLSHGSGWVLPADAVRVDPASEFANPFRWIGSVGSSGGEWWVERGSRRWYRSSKAEVQQLAVTLHADWMAEPEQTQLRRRVRGVFKERRPACWCALDGSCHGDTLVFIATTPKDGT